jgi:hypothetical protein
MNKIKILIPGRDYTRGFFQSLLGLVHSLGDLQVEILNYSGPYLPEVRNQLLLNGQQPTKDIEPFGGEYDYVLWVETDIVFSRDDFFNLYRCAIQNDLEFVTGLFPMGPAQPNWAVAGTWTDGRLPMTTSGLVHIDYCGVGFLLIRRGVYEKLGFPWYGAGVIYAQKPSGEWLYLGDDFSTSRRIQESGTALWALGDVKLGHEKSIIVRGDGL